MQTEIEVLMVAAITISCLHTIAGPDHYVPFIALSKSRGWSLSKTLLWTIICGCAHVWSSVLLGLGAAAIGWSFSKIQWFEDIRGGIAGWTLVGFGLVYGVWGLINATRGKRHKHFDFYEDGSIYVYEHREGEIVAPAERHKVTPWIMFVIFLLGPCEPMIPLLFFPAVKSSWWGIILLVIVYTFFTLVTMATIVIIGYYGFAFVKTEKLERYTHALGGATIFACGTGMVFLGW